MLRSITIIILALFVAWASYFLFMGDSANGEVKKDAYIVSGMEKCHAEGGRKCLEELAVGLLDRYTIPEILESFKMHEREEAFYRTCHEEAHYLGREAYRRIGSISEVYGQSNEVCLGGVFHGALEGYFIENDLILGNDNLNNIKRAVANICEEVEAKTIRSFGQCHHGLGHALMFVAEDNLVDALSLCDALETVANREGCYTGAFMQNVVNAGSADHPIYMLSEGDPLYPCNVLSEKYQPICYTYAVLEHYQGDVEKGIELCGMVPKEFGEECFRTFGRNGVMYTDSIDTLILNCGKIGSAAYRQACLSSSASELLVRYQFDSRSSIDLCLKVDDIDQVPCFKRLGQIAGTLTSNKEEISNFCAAISNESYRNLCKAEGI